MSLEQTFHVIICWVCKQNSPKKNRSLVYPCLSGNIYHLQHSETNFQNTLIPWTFVKVCQSIPSFFKTRKNNGHVVRKLHCAHPDRSQLDNNGHFVRKLHCAHLDRSQLDNTGESNVCEKNYQKNVSHFNAHQSVQRFATGWTVRDSDSGRDETFRTRPQRVQGSPSLLYSTGYFQGVSGQGVALSTYPPPVLGPRLKKKKSYIRTSGP